MCRRLIFENEPLFERLAATSFNLAIVDGVMFTKCVYLIPHRLRIPVVTYTGLIDPLTVRVPWLPSFVPGLLTGFSDHMSFVQRLGNAATMFAFWMFNPADGGCGNVVDEFRRRHGPVAGGLNALAAQSLIWLVATDHVIDYPKPSMPNVVVNVGGLTVGRSAGHLPPDIQSFVSGARRGAVVVTFGSMVSRLPASIVRKFLDSFRRLDNDGLRFVWRLNASDVDVGDEFPENVIVRWWLPQNDLLAHPSVRLFITHCGNNGQYEAVYHGVPMIGFPLMGDQRHNAQRLVRKGFGVAMDLHRFDVDELVANIRAVAGGDRRYADRVRRASEIFRSAPETPVERAAYWVEHVARFGGEHLRSGGQELPLYAYLMLDVMAVVLLVVAVLAYCVYRLMRLVYGVVRLVGQSAPCAVKLMVKMAFGQYDEKRVGGWMASEDFSPKIVNDALL